MTETARSSAADQPPRPLIRWSARVLSWLCWLIIALTAGIAAMKLFNALPQSWIVEGGEGLSSTLFHFGTGMTDPVANAEVMKGLRADWLNRIVGLLPSALFIWALLSARRSFVGVARGEYFARPTILGLRNLSLAVLLYQTVAPLVVFLPRALYFAAIKGDREAQISASISINEPIALVLIFTAVVALVSTVMVRAAKLADENRQFV
jgi:hypothetical protein